MKNSKHPALVSKVAAAGEKNKKKTLECGKKSKDWAKSAAQAAKEMTDAAKLFDNWADVIKENVDRYSGMVKRIVEIEALIEGADKAKGKKINVAALEKEHTKLNKDCDELFKAMAEAHSASIDGQMNAANYISEQLKPPF